MSRVKCYNDGMIDEIAHNLLRIEIPLPGNPLKAVNSYVLRGDGRTLIIDTGQPREECKKAMLEAVGKLGIDLKKTDFFITHLHNDHLGLLYEIVEPSSVVYMNRMEAKFVRSLGPRERVFRWAEIYKSNGFPEDVLQTVVEGHLANLSRVRRHINFTPLDSGDLVNFGDFSFRCIDTPGHSPGHMCLYEASKKIFVSGDHVLFDITPNIKLYPEMDNALKSYLTSLDKVYPLDVKLVLPGHRRIYDNHRARISEIKEHHKHRLAEIITALEKGDKTGYEIAQCVTWDLSYKTWEEFPSAQKWFAVGEVMAHLQYLEAENKVRKEQRRDKITYLLN